MSTSASRFVSTEKVPLINFLRKTLGLVIQGKGSNKVVERDVTRGFIRLKFELPYREFMPSEMLYPYLEKAFGKENIIKTLWACVRGKLDSHIVTQWQKAVDVTLNSSQLQDIVCGLKDKGIPIDQGVPIIEQLQKIHDKGVYRSPGFRITKQPLLPKSYLFTEKYLQHEHWYFENCQREHKHIQLTSLPAFTAPKTHEIHEGRSYFILDFRDFIEYATSNLAPKVSLDLFQPNHIYLYDALNGTYQEPLFDYGVGGFSVVGAALSRKEWTSKTISTFRTLYLCEVKMTPSALPRPRFP